MAFSYAVAPILDQQPPHFWLFETNFVALHTNGGTEEFLLRLSTDKDSTIHAEVLPLRFFVDTHLLSRKKRILLEFTSLD